MQKKSLKEKAINIKGRSYVLVSDRIIYFNENYPNGFITTHLMTPVESDHIIIRATVVPDATNNLRLFTGLSQATVGDGVVNKTAALENAETSAVGRALALMGIGVIDSVASVDEINKATGSKGLITDKQKKLILDILSELKEDPISYEDKIGRKLSELTTSEASKCIKVLQERVQKARSAGDIPPFE